MSLERMKTEFALLQRTIGREFPEALVQERKLEELKVSTCALVTWHFRVQVQSREEPQPRAELPSEVLSESQAQAQLEALKRQYEERCVQLSAAFKQNLIALTTRDLRQHYDLAHQRTVLAVSEELVYRAPCPRCNGGPLPRGEECPHCGGSGVVLRRAHVAVVAEPEVTYDPTFSCPELSAAVQHEVLMALEQHLPQLHLHTHVRLAGQELEDGALLQQFELTLLVDRYCFAVNGLPYEIVYLPQIKTIAEPAYVFDDITVMPFLQAAQQLLAQRDQEGARKLLRAAQHSPYLQALICADERSAGRLSSYPLLEEDAAAAAPEVAAPAGIAAGMGAAEASWAQTGSLVSPTQQAALVDAISALTHLNINKTLRFWATVLPVGLALQAAIMVGICSLGLAGWINVGSALVLTVMSSGWLLWWLRLNFRHGLQRFCTQIGVSDWMRFRARFIDPSQYELTWPLLGVGAALLLNLTVALVL